MKAVEATVGREGFTKALVWMEGHLTDRRSKCVVELLDRWRNRSKVDLEKLDAMAKRRR
jgi:hypothetical protein